MNPFKFNIVKSIGTKKPGAAPGTLVHIGEQMMQEMQLVIHDYDINHVDEVKIEKIEESRPYLESISKTWIKVYGVHDIEKLQNIWSYFDLHPLVQEDIVNTAQRPKVELYDNNLFIVLRMVVFSDEDHSLEGEQVSIVLGENYVLSFQESDRPIFNPILERLKIDTSRLRRLGPDYLAYALMDTIVDHYFNALGAIADHIEETEDELLNDPTQSTFQKIHGLRRELILFRKSVWPARDMLNSLLRDDSPFINDNTKIYIRDVYDHMVQIIDNLENYRDTIVGLHDMYMSHVSNKMNEVMKVLTIIATIFIPLTFIAGIYGMNFNTEVSPYNLPELDWYWAYPAFWVVMIVISTFMVLYFKRKGWL